MMMINKAFRGASNKSPLKRGLRKELFFSQSNNVAAVNDPPHWISRMNELARRCENELSLFSRPLPGDELVDSDLERGNLCVIATK